MIKNETIHTRKIRPLLLIVFFLLVSVWCFSQTQQNTLSPNNLKYKHPLEKVYLHTDRELYAVNDTIWYRAYLVNAHTLTPDQSPLRNIYVELIDENKKVTACTMLACVKGISFGDFSLHNYHLKPGKYNLRAYTDYQTNFPTEFLFQKPLLITPVFDPQQTYQSYYDSVQSSHQQAHNKNINTQETIDLQFLPEGGKLTIGINNKLAFKALNDKGVGTHVQGDIFQQNGQKVASFESTYRGMGFVQFKPDKNQHYYAKINKSGKQYPLPPATNLIHMTVSKNDSLLNIRLKSNRMDIEPQIYHLEVRSRGIIQYSATLPVNKPYIMHKIATQNLVPGINQITLLDNTHRPLRNRLIFVEKTDTASLHIQLNTESSTNSAETKIELTCTHNHKLLPNTSLSIAVCDADLSPRLQTQSGNIYTSLLLESELKGNIEDPSAYFDKNNPQASENLDLLMLTQGWSDYNWNQVLNKTPQITKPKQFGIKLEGSASQHFMNRKLKNKLLTFSMMQNDQLYYDSIVTDSEGRFSIPELILPDSTEVAFAVPGKNTNKYRIKLQDNTPAYPVSAFYNFELPAPAKIEPYQQFATQRYRYDKQQNPGKYNIMLQDILVEKQIDDIDIIDSHLRPYPKADRAIITNDDDQIYTNPLYYVSRSISKVFYDGETIYFKGLGTAREQTSPAFLLDGMEVDQLSIENTPMDVVARVEVVYEPTSLIMWPHNSQAQKGGVISVFTKRSSKHEEYKNSEMHHTVRGYYLSRKFYSPKYENKHRQTQNEKRSTLMWIPVLNTDENGKAQFSFNHFEQNSGLIIHIEGITSYGEPVYVKKQAMSENDQ